MKASTKKIKKGKATASTRQFDNFNNTKQEKTYCRASGGLELTYNKIGVERFTKWTTTMLESIGRC